MWLANSVQDRVVGLDHTRPDQTDTPNTLGVQNKGKKRKEKKEGGKTEAMH